ncbi:MAG: 50S ribosomal protein L15 [Phycisphaeraceae bacterium]|nr:50S ribosomal protein L15 [Phycisphaeraceae bacterium]
MMIHDITALAGAYKNRKRVGRGEGSGHGKQSGRGNKGASSRSGYSRKRSFEGGQMPYFRRLPKFGFTNAPFKVEFWTVNIGDIISHPDFKSGGEINAATLIAAGLVRDESRDLKILGSMGKAQGVKAKYTVVAARVTASARKLVVDAGGSVNETGTRRDRVRGIDRNSEDKTPKNLTKKLRRGNNKKSAPAPAAE